MSQRKERRERRRKRITVKEGKQVDIFLWVVFCLFCNVRLVMRGVGMAAVADDSGLLCGEG